MRFAAPPGPTVVAAPVPREESAPEAEATPATPAADDSKPDSF
jgi:hypothetical protein